MGRDDRGKRRDVGSRAEDSKGQQPTSLLPQTPVSDRGAANTKQAQARSPVLQAYGYATSWLCKRDLPLCRTLYPINKSDSIILYQNNILAFNKHNCQYPESRIINHSLLLPTLSNFMLRRQGWMGSLIWIRNTVTCSALCLLTLCGRAGSVGLLLSIQFWGRGGVRGEAKLFLTFKTFFIPDAIWACHKRLWNHGYYFSVFFWSCGQMTSFPRPFSGILESSPKQPKIISPFIRKRGLVYFSGRSGTTHGWLTGDNLVGRMWTKQEHP